jgi:hypothetical protein
MVGEGQMPSFPLTLASTHNQYYKAGYIFVSYNYLQPLSVILGFGIITHIICLKRRKKEAFQ